MAIEQHQPQLEQPNYLRRAIAAAALLGVTIGGVLTFSGEAVAADGSPDPTATSSASANPTEAPTALPTESVTPTTAPAPTTAPTSVETPTATATTTTTPPVEAPTSQPSSTTTVTRNNNASPTAAALSIATYNVIGDTHAAAGKAVGGPLAKRMQRIGSVVEAHHPNIVGFQEVTSPTQRHLLEKSLPDYKFYGPDVDQNPIAIWKAENRLSVKAVKTFHYPYYNANTPAGRDGMGTILDIKDNQSGKDIMILNDHQMAHGDHPNRLMDKGGAMGRLETSKIERKIMVAAHKKNPNAILFNVGDKNSTNNIRNKADRLTPIPKDPALHNDRDKLEYCIQTEPIGKGSHKEYFLQSALDMEKGLVGHCPDKSHTSQSNFEVDWIFGSPQTFDVDHVTLVKPGGTSDHAYYQVDGFEQPEQASQK